MENGLAVIDVDSSLKLMQVSNELFKSNLYPNLKNAAGAFAVVQYGAELGIPPMMALQNINLIEGKPAANAQLIQGLIKRAGVKITVLESTDKVCKLRFACDGISIDESFSIEEARQAGLADKSNWKRYPKDMLYWRCVTRGGRRIKGEAILGLYSIEELSNGDYVNSNEVIKDVTPSREEQKQAVKQHVEEVVNTFPSDGSEELKDKLKKLLMGIKDNVKAKMKEKGQEQFKAWTHYQNAVMKYARDTEQDLPALVKYIADAPSLFIEDFVSYRSNTLIVESES